jgi:hypothetical protein
MFQTITLELAISIPEDSFQLFYQCNPTNIDPDMTILVSMIGTQFWGRILVCHEKFNNSTTPDPFQSVRSALEISTPVDAFWVFYHQNWTTIGKDTTICVSSNALQFKYVILFVVTRT